MSNKLMFFYILFKLSVADAARILAVFPTPAFSHQAVFRVLTLELVKRGHEVVVITPDPAFSKGQAPANLTEINIHDVSYQFMRNVLTDMKIQKWLGKDSECISLQTKLNEFIRIIEVQVLSEPVQKLIREKREFDIMLIEAYLRRAVVFSHLYKAPVILVSSFGPTIESLEIIGAPTHPLLYSTPFCHRPNHASFWNRLQEYYYHVQYLQLKKTYERLDNEILQKTFGPNVPSIAELNKNVDLLFLNVHPMWMNNQPVPPGVIFMGGIHQKSIAELPEDLKEFLDSSENGVIYVSFGTIVYPVIFSPERLQVITEALSELSYDVLFKWDDDDLPGKSENIHISKWFPQSDLLRHPKVKAFLTQGGLQSTDEAIAAGVPLVCIPMLGDQWYNADQYVRFNIGLKLDLPTLTKSQLKSAMESVILNKSYRENIVKLRERMYDQLQSPLERAVWWVEYALRHGGARHLRAPAANMSWAEYYELELVLIVFTCLLISIFICLLVATSLLRYIIQFLNSSKFVKMKLH